MCHGERSTWAILRLEPLRVRKLASGSPGTSSMQTTASPAAYCAGLPTFYTTQHGTALQFKSTVVLGSRLKSPRLRAEPAERDYVSYEGEKSVFPAEACEEVGGTACEVEGVGEEVKPKPKPEEPAKAAKFPERDYVEYTDKKTVFPGEACDELGGEFCGPEYQKGVFPDKSASK